MGRGGNLLEEDLSLSRIHVDNISRSVNNQIEVNLTETNLSRIQILQIFGRMGVKTSLRYLDMRGCDVRIVTEYVYTLAKQNCHFILHDFDRNLIDKIVGERFFGNKGFAQS